MGSTTYVNAGAYVAGERPRTKRELREALRTVPHLVTFDCTALDKSGVTMTPADITDGSTVMQVTGPDPYTRRTWYARCMRVGGRYTCD